MREGRITEPVWKRSVLRRTENRREEVILRAGMGRAGNLLHMPEGLAAVSAEAGFLDSMRYGSDVSGRIFFHRAVNACAAMGAKPVAVQVQLLFPARWEEPELRKLVDALEEEARDLGISLLPGRILCSLAEEVPYLTLNAFGECEDKLSHPCESAKAGQELVVGGWIALEATVLLAGRHREELLSRFTPVFVERVQNFARDMSVAHGAAIAAEYGASVILPIEEGGIFGALWELAEGAGLGLEAQAGDIPVRQETIEICELYRKNPYQLPSAGSLLIAAEHGGQLCSLLGRAGIPSAVIGRLTDGNDRVLYHGEEKRFLELPRMDA